MLAIGRRLMSRPKLLLLDEASLGLAPFVVREIAGIIRQLHQEEGGPSFLWNRTQGWLFIW